ncbi:hypothetical protein DB347_09940 [Opitutaceae bacterium EW11]|nr:hypothetical protein DB347_09940 [Opitutaceae bacterium EW11]
MESASPSLSLAVSANRTTRCRSLIDLLRFVAVLGFALCGAARGTADGARWIPLHRDHAHESRSRFERELPLTVQADHPAIVPLVAAIRRVSSDPLEQLVIVNDVTHLLVDYDEDERVYGQIEYHATLDEMLERRRSAGWLYLRDDCDGRAVFAAHLLAGLGIPWKLRTSYWKRHAWIVARVGGVEYDLLDLRKDSPELARESYRLFGHWFVHPSRPPPYFQWRRAWLDRTHGDVAIGLRLGLLEMGSTAASWRERFSTDWTRVHPDGTMSPWDERTLTAACAGFPYGEALHPGALASRTEQETPIASTSSASVAANAPLAAPTSAR